MAALIPAVWVIACLLLLGSGLRLRESSLGAFTVVAVAVIGSTELLTLVSALNATAVGITWLALLVAVSAAGRRRITQGAAKLRMMASVSFSPADWLTAAVLALFGLGTLASALLYPPANYDSLTAHMPRVFFWIQYETAAHYPTSFGPQMFSGSLVAYFITHLKLLAGGTDRLVGLAQWSAYGFSIVTASLIASRLGASRRGQQVAAVAAASTPMALLQASTTQTDLMTALWCLTAVYCLLGYMDEDRPSLSLAVGWAAWAGIALALASQSKASAYLICAPFFLWAAVTVIRRESIVRLATMAGVVLVCVLAINIGHFARNASVLDGDLIGSRAPGMAHILVQDSHVEALITNSLKNVSMLAGTPSGALNDAVAGTVSTVIRAYGGQVENPLTQENVSGEYRLDGRITNHDVGPAPATLLLVGFSLLVLAVLRGSKRRTGWYLLCALAALFVTGGLVSWNLFINRVLLGPVLLLTPAVGVAFTLIRRKPSRWLKVTMLGLLGMCVAWGAFVMAFNSSHRLVSPSVVPMLPFERDLGYWNSSYEDLRFRVLVPELEEPFRNVAEAIDAAGIERVGIHDRIAHFPVYPLLHLLSSREVGYVREIVLADRMSEGVTAPQAIVEIVPAEEYPSVLEDGTPRGDMLVEPQLGGDTTVILVYLAP